VTRQVLEVTHMYPPDDVVNDNRVWGVKQGMQSLRYFGELHPRNAEYLFQVLVTVDKFPFVSILYVTVAMIVIIQFLIQRLEYLHTSHGQCQT
jgi:hypothetical protein